MIKEKILNYLEATIQTKHNMRKRIYQLEEELKEARANERYITNQYTSYKKLNKQYKQTITEYKKTLQQYCIEIKELQKTIKKQKRKEK